MAQYPTSSSSSPPQPLPLHQTPPLIQPKSQPLQSQLQQQMLQLQQNMVQLRQQTLQKQQEMARLPQQLNGSGKIINTNIAVSSFQSNPSASRVHNTTDQLRISNIQLQQQMEQFRVQNQKQQSEQLRCLRSKLLANCGGSFTQVSINQLGGKRKMEDLLSEEGAVYKFHPGASHVQSIRGLQMIQFRNLSSQVRPKKPLAPYTKPIRMTAPPQQLNTQILSHQIAVGGETITRTSFTNAGLMQQNATTGQKRLKQMVPPISSNSSCSSCLLQPQHLQNLRMHYMQIQSQLLLIQQQLASFLRMKAVNLRGSQPDDAATAASPTIAPPASSIVRLPALGSNGRMDCDVEDLADDFVDVVRLTDSQIPASNPSSL